ncbi:MAG: hypothetical protein PHT95_02475 [Candidatus Omnitrophica bacterium]|nr:hypothetical protein [Candidatus Omnitrophota bacterium]MDD4012692.1 hypothetical protein [Candidatus Omnitrophota bacterium]
METLKNFITGVLAIVLSLIVLAVVSLAWPLIIGLGSIILSLAAGIFFLLLVFYFIVLVGYVVRYFMKR